MNKSGSAIGSMFKVTCVAGGLSLLCGTSFLLGRVRGWIDALVIACNVMDEIKDESERNKKTSCNK